MRSRGSCQRDGMQQGRLSIRAGCMQLQRNVDTLLIGSNTYSRAHITPTAFITDDVKLRRSDARHSMTDVSFYLW